MILLDTTASPLLPLPDPEDEKFNEIGSGGGPHASSPNKTRLISDEDWTKLADKLKVNKKKLPLLKKIGEKIDTVIDRVNENNGRVAPELFVEEFLPDPLKIKDIPISKNDGLFTWYSGRFSNIEMYGVSTVKIESVKINVGKFTAKVRQKQCQLATPTNAHFAPPLFSRCCLMCHLFIWLEIIHWKER